MDNNQFQQLMRKLDGIHTSLAAIGRAMKSDAPNYQRPLAAYATFDFASVDAVVLEADSSGPSRVEYLGHIFTRRNGTGKFGQAIWFSRPMGKNEDGSNRYARLVTFKDYSDAEELDSRLEDALEEGTPPPTQPKSQANGSGRQPATPPPATPAPKPAQPGSSNPSQLTQTEWLQRAQEATDEMDFDVCVSRAYPDFYFDANRVQTVREGICGKWDTAKKGATLAAVAEYCTKRLEWEKKAVSTTEAHKEAKIAARRAYNNALKEKVAA
ncbi:MAG: hypothetical protein H6658_02230 [Ardenticatenaceae bacterium]|nr:hypothetical protein [Ardenticatenaceae bacterium]